MKYKNNWIHLGYRIEPCRHAKNTWASTLEIIMRSSFPRTKEREVQLYNRCQEIQKHENKERSKPVSTV